MASLGMPSMGAYPASAYPIDYSRPTTEVLDLSRRPAPQEYNYRSSSPGSRSLSSTSPMTFVQHPGLSPRINSSPDVCMEHGSTESINYGSRNTSPSLYHHSNEESHVKPGNIPSQLSPIPACPPPEHLNPYLLNAAFQQQLIIQARIPTKSESEPVPETSAEPTSNPANIPMLLMQPSGSNGKVTRPFKAYPKDPLSLVSGLAVDAIMDPESIAKYNSFRSYMIGNMNAANGGFATVTNPKMRRTISSAAGKHEEGKDETYAERRMKNNAAAKKSRDRRRIKEDEIAIRAAFLEKENLELRLQLANIKRQHSFCSLR